MVREKYKERGEGGIKSRHVATGGGGGGGGHVPPKKFQDRLNFFRPLFFLPRSISCLCPPNIKLWLRA